jgi:hypothetical protein
VICEKSSVRMKVTATRMDWIQVVRIHLHSVLLECVWYDLLCFESVADNGDT